VYPWFQLNSYGSLYLLIYSEANKSENVFAPIKDTCQLKNVMKVILGKMAVDKPVFQSLCIILKFQNFFIVKLLKTHVRKDL